MRLTVLLFTRSCSKDEGRLTKQFLRCTSDSSTGAACPLLEAIAASRRDNTVVKGKDELQQWYIADSL